MQRTARFLSLVAAIAVAACGQPVTPSAADTSAADEAAIRATTDEFLSAWNAADMVRLAAMYPEDAVRMQPDGPSLEGRDAILQSFTEFFAEFDAQQTAVVDEVGVFGDVGFGRGTWSVTQRPKAGGDEAARHGKWFVMHRRQDDGSWKTWRWMWNEPVTPEAAAGG